MKMKMLKCCGALIGLLLAGGAHAAPNPLLGVQTGFPDILFSSGPGQGCNYNGTTLTITSQPLTVTYISGGTPSFVTGGIVTISAKIDGTGAFSGVGSTFSITGVVDAFGSPLLTGTITTYGIADLGTTDRADFQMSATGGSLLSSVGGSGAVIGAIVTMGNSTYAGSFATISGQICGIAKGNIGPIPPAGGGPGTGTIGYWKNHPTAWPVTSLTLGGVLYTQSPLIQILDMAVKGDKSISLAKQLIGAKLNVAAGNDSSCISATIAASDTWLTAHGGVGSGQKQWDGGDALHDELDAYNNGDLCAPHRP